MKLEKVKLAFTGFNRSGSYQNTTQADCYIEVLMCSYGEDHVAGQGCVDKPNPTLYLKKIAVLCQDNGGGSGGSGDISIGDPFNGGGGSSGSDGDDLGDPFSGGSSSGESGTGSTGTNNDGFDSEVVTSPVAPEITSLTPCNQLKSLFNKPKPDIKKTITEYLQPDILINAKGEKAAYLQKLPSGTMGTTVSTPTSTNSVGIRTGGNHYAAIHTHPNTCYPMFSWSDVLVLKTLYDNLEPHNIGMANFTLVCQDESGVFQTYAIVLNTEGFNTLDLVFNSPFGLVKLQLKLL